MSSPPAAAAAALAEEKKKSKKGNAFLDFFKRLAPSQSKGCAPPLKARGAADLLGHSPTSAGFGASPPKQRVGCVPIHQRRKKKRALKAALAGAKPVAPVFFYKEIELLIRLTAKYSLFSAVQRCKPRRRTQTSKDSLAPGLPGLPRQTQSEAAVGGKPTRSTTQRTRSTRRRTSTTSTP